MRRLLPLAMVSLLVLPAGCGKIEFKDFTSPEGKFTILMPGTPEKKTQTIHNMMLVMYGMNVKNGAYAAGYADIPPGTPFSLPGAVQGIAGSHGGKVLSEKDYTLEGKTGREFEIETTTPKGFVSGRVIVINNRLYQILALGTNARLSNADVQKFLNSFKLTK